jgi:hypothetical protein
MRTDRGLLWGLVALSILVLPATAAAVRGKVAPVHQGAPPPEIFDRVQPSLVRVYAQDSVGMAVAVVDGTLFVTCDDVVSNTAWVEVESGPGERRRAEVLAWKGDVAILGIEQPLSGVQPLPLADAGPQVGRTVWTVTPPAGPGLGPWALHEGRVASRGEHRMEIDVFGSSATRGGPVVNGDGRLVGVVTSPRQGEVVAAAAEAIEEALGASAGAHDGPPPALGFGMNLTYTGHDGPLGARHQEEFGLGLGGYALAGRYAMIPWIVRVVGDDSAWRPELRRDYHLRFEVMTGFGGDFELTVQRRPYMPMVFQLYALVGVATGYDMERSEWISQTDPLCDATVSPCEVDVDLREEIDRRTAFAFGGGARVRMLSLLLGLEVTTTATSQIGEDFRVVVVMGLDLRRNRVAD